jgi:ATP-dependent DNA helicase DinG
MIAEIANALGDPDAPEPIAVVEAGTGTGKTIAYTLAALPLARAKQKKLVIATATVALQEQLINKDLPDILRHSGLSFSVQLAKGRGRYVCVQKLDQHMAGLAQSVIPLYPDEVGDDALVDAGPLLDTMLSALGEGSWDGDLDSWTMPLEGPIRRMVTTDHIHCAGRRCPHIQQCPFFLARDGLIDADIIVTNHDLVLSDLKLGGGAILPPPDECFYVFDEGHQLPDKCLNHFTLSVRASSTLLALKETASWLDKAEQTLVDVLDVAAIVTPLAVSILQLEQQTRIVEDWALSFLLEQEGDTREYRFEHGVAPEALIALAEGLRDAWEHQLALAMRLEARCESGVKEVERQLQEDAEAWLTSAGALVARAEAQHALWTSYAASAETQRGVPWARWLQTTRQGDSVEFLASPVLASDLLREHLWGAAAGVVITSATLSALGTFERFRMRSGVPSGARFKQVVSPFDPKKARFVVPKLRFDPSKAEGHTQEIIERLPQLIEADLGALVLFSSRRQMEEVVAGVTGQLTHAIWVQDTLSKTALLERHKEHVDRGEPSVIMGLASFAEGIDLPGAYCAHVVIAKLPFAVPDNPLEAAHAELLQREGRNPFMEISVPDAAIKLVQASGRLLRTETDSGQITLLDNRVVTKAYGRSILASLPAYQFDLAR